MLTLTLQHMHGRTVQIGQQFILPRIPHLRTGATNVGHSQQIQGTQAFRRFHLFSKAQDNIGVGQILFLCKLRHGQMLGHQKFNQGRLRLIQPMLFGKANHFHRTQIRMIAAASFGNIVV